MSEHPPTLPVRIIGTGSPLGADRLGWLAVRRLEATGIKERHPANTVEVDICQSPALLAAQCSPAQALILLDAYCSDDLPGSVRQFAAGDLDTVLRPASSHGFDIRQALELYAALVENPPPLSIIGVCVGQKPYETDEQSCASILETAFPELVKVIDKAINGNMEQLPAIARTPTLLHLRHDE